MAPPIISSISSRSKALVTVVSSKVMMMKWMRRGGLAVLGVREVKGHARVPCWWLCFALCVGSFSGHRTVMGRGRRKERDKVEWHEWGTRCQQWMLLNDGGERRRGGVRLWWRKKKAKCPCSVSVTFGLLGSTKKEKERWGKKGGMAHMWLRRAVLSESKPEQELGRPKLGTKTRKRKEAAGTNLGLSLLPGWASFSSFLIQCLF